MLRQLDRLELARRTQPIRRRRRKSPSVQRACTSIMLFNVPRGKVSEE